MNKLRLLIVALVVLGIIFAAQCLYTVKPYQSVEPDRIVQLRFGRMVQPCRVFDKYNLYLKWPNFIDRYVPIDQRLQVTDVVLETVKTAGKEFQVTAACSGFWRVKDPNKFSISLLATLTGSVPEPDSSFPKTINDTIRDTIRSGVNNVFGETPFS